LAEDDELEKIKKRMMKEILNASRSSHWSEEGVVELDASNFDEALNDTEKPVLVDFWAEWCAPCSMMKPVMEALAREYSGKANMAKVNVDQNQMLARKFGVMSIPNFVIFSGGKPVGRLIGAVGNPRLEAALQKYLMESGA
jgi:thioredoxin 1